MPFLNQRILLDSVLFVLTVATCAMAVTSGGYTQFVIGLVAITTILGTGLNVLYGLTGLVSLGQLCTRRRELEVQLQVLHVVPEGKERPYILKCEV